MPDTVLPIFSLLTFTRIECSGSSHCHHFVKKGNSESLALREDAWCSVLLFNHCVCFFPTPLPPPSQVPSVPFSRSVLSDSLRPCESQHTRPPCPSPTLEFTQTQVHQVSDAIQPSHPLLSPSPPAPNPSQHQSLFQ